jgi:hypothetical protein
MIKGVTVFNIREYLSVKDDMDLGEEELAKLLSEFSLPCIRRNAPAKHFVGVRGIRMLSDFFKSSQLILRRRISLLPIWFLKMRMRRWLDILPWR